MQNNKCKGLLIFLLAVSFAFSSFFAEKASAQDLVLKLARVLTYQKKYDEALRRYREYLGRHPKDYRAHLEAGDVYYWNGDYQNALLEYQQAENDPKLRKETSPKIAEILTAKRDYQSAKKSYQDVLAHESGNLEVRVKYADLLSYERNYKEALAEYDYVLERDPNNLKALEGKAAVLSWARRYKESEEIYRRRLELKYDPEIERQLARMLGWAKKFSDSLSTYNSAYEKSQSEAIIQEMGAKEAYWNRNVLTALKNYRRLVDLEPDNNEARFDLGQVEGYEKMWKEAAGDFQKVIDLDPTHFRAEDGLYLTNVLWKKRALAGEFLWFRARSDDRATYINRVSAGALFSQPLGQIFTARAGYKFDTFYYTGRSSVDRHQGRIGLEFSGSPYVWGWAAYYPTKYNLAGRFSSLFEGSLSVRPVDPIILTAFTLRDDLYNNRTVFEKQLRSTDVGGRIQADIHRRWTLYGDYKWSDLNDGNVRNGFGIENLLYILYEPTRLTADVRFDFYNYKYGVADYFSPDNFWATTVTFHWRHYLNPEGIYFGAKNTYYGIKYKFQIDREKKIFNGGAVEFYHDFSHRFAVQAEAFGLYGTVYNDVGATASLIGRF